MRSSLKKCDEVRCPRYEEIAMELSQSQNYLAIMSETINSECCKGITSLNLNWLLDLWI